jgi:type IX secretion system substrate protein
MAPNSYLIVWADEDLSEEGLHADFKLSAGGESVILSYPNGTIIDMVAYGTQTANVSYARIPDGTGDFVSQANTFNGNNENLTIDNAVRFTMEAYPNPVSDMLHITAMTEIQEVVIYNLPGQQIISGKFNNSNVELNTCELKSGIYIVKVKGINGSASVKIVKN